MHTVIILNRHSSELLKDFRFLFKPFLEEGNISFCDWNESGTDIMSSVPDLYKVIKGKQHWRAFILNTESMCERPSAIKASENNPFDFSGSIEDSEIPKESEVPYVRLAHMLCGYPSTTVKNFVKGFEYYDYENGETIRVKESDLSEEQFFQLYDKSGGILKSIYIEEGVSDEVKKAQKELEKKYNFTDIRPSEVLFIGTRPHGTEAEHIYASWQNQYEMDSSNFCARNHYPSTCRFLCYSITNVENSLYVKELMEWWLSILTLAINKIPASTLQAYRLYQFGVEVSEEELGDLLNRHLNRMESVYDFVLQRMRVESRSEFEPLDIDVEKQNIPVIFEGVSGDQLYISTKGIGLARDCPREELAFWNEQILEKESDLGTYFKMPRRAVDKASRFLRGKAESFYGEEYELDKFQMEDLQDDLNKLELQVLLGETHNIIDEEKTKEEIHKIDRKVRKSIGIRMRKGTVIGVGVAILLIYALGFLPYLVHSFRYGGKAVMASLGLTLLAVGLVSIGGIIALFLLRKQLLNRMQEYNDLIRYTVNNTNASAKQFESYFSSVCTYMKAKSIHIGSRLKKESKDSLQFKLKMHKQALRISIQRDEALAVSYGIKRVAEVEHNITSFFDEQKMPKDNHVYFYVPDRSETLIPINIAGDLGRTPYKFIQRLKIERLDIYDETKGDKEA